MYKIPIDCVDSIRPSVLSDIITVCSTLSVDRRRVHNPVSELVFRDTLIK